MCNEYSIQNFRTKYLHLNDCLLSYILFIYIYIYVVFTSVLLVQRSELTNLGNQLHFSIESPREGFNDTFLNILSMNQNTIIQIFGMDVQLVPVFLCL